MFLNHISSKYATSVQMLETSLHRVSNKCPKQVCNKITTSIHKMCPTSVQHLYNKSTRVYNKTTTSVRKLRNRCTKRLQQPYTQCLTRGRQVRNKRSTSVQLVFNKCSTSLQQVLHKYSAVSHTCATHLCNIPK